MLRSRTTGFVLDMPQQSELEALLTAGGQAILPVHGHAAEGAAPQPSIHKAENSAARERAARTSCSTWISGKSERRAASGERASVFRSCDDSLAFRHFSS